jgi:hypothetical protein
MWWCRAASAHLVSQHLVHHAQDHCLVDPLGKAQMHACTLAHKLHVHICVSCRCIQSRQLLLHCYQTVGSMPFTMFQQGTLLLLGACMRCLRLLQPPPFQSLVVTAHHLRPRLLLLCMCLVGGKTATPAIGWFSNHCDKLQTHFCMPGAAP